MADEQNATNDETKEVPPEAPKEGLEPTIEKNDDEKAKVEEKADHVVGDGGGDQGEQGPTAEPGGDEMVEGEKAEEMKETKLDSDSDGDGAEKKKEKKGKGKKKGKKGEEKKGEGKKGEEKVKSKGKEKPKEKSKGKAPKEKTEKVVPKKEDVEKAPAKKEHPAPSRMRHYEEGEEGGSEEDFEPYPVVTKPSKKGKKDKQATKKKPKKEEQTVTKTERRTLTRADRKSIGVGKKRQEIFSYDEEASEEGEMGEEMLEEEDPRKKKKRTPKKPKSLERIKEKKKSRRHLEGSEEEEEEDSSISSDDFYGQDISYEDEDEPEFGKHIEKHKKTKKKRDYERDYFDIDESSSVSSDVPSYIKNEEESVEPEMDVTDLMGPIPDVEDMTYTSSDVTLLRKPIPEPVEEPPPVEVPVAVEPQDDGSSLDIPIDKLSEADVEGEGEESAESIESSEPTDSLDLWELDHLPHYSDLDLVEVSGALKTVEEDALKELLEFEEVKVVTEEVVDTEEHAKEELENALLHATRHFLYDLIDVIVDMCIEQEENTFLLKNLDKLRMMKAIIKRHELLEQERVICKFVDRKVVEHFKKKKMFTPITADPPDSLKVIMEKYEESYAKLDEAMIRKKATRDLKELVVEQLYNDKDDAEADDIEKIQHLERLIRRTMVRDSSKMNELVDMRLAKMRQMRNEISKMRLVIIRQQHLMDYYTQKFSEINDLGDGLLMSDYEYLRIKTDSLSKKVEERNKDLKKSVIRFHSDMHAVAHIKGKEKIMKLLILELNEIYDNYYSEKCDLRKELHSQKIKREIIRKEIVSINSRGGLLPRPMLMSDFDNTNEKIAEARQRITKLRELAAEYEEKLGKGI